MTSNNVTLIHYNFDWRVIPLAAWASTGVDPMELSLVPVESRLEYLFSTNKNDRLRSPESLVKFLHEHGHNSPFRHLNFIFLVKTEKPTHIQFLKHRVGVEINSESARYKRLNPSYYIPEDMPLTIQAKLQAHYDCSQELYEEIYNELIEAGFSKQRAKESARFALPEGHQISYQVSMSAEALRHFYQLRTSRYAQLEISLIAQSMVRQVLETGKFDILEDYFLGE